MSRRFFCYYQDIGEKRQGFQLSKDREFDIKGNLVNGMTGDVEGYRRFVLDPISIKKFIIRSVGAQNG